MITAGIAALACNTSAYIVEILRGALGTISRGQRAAAYAMPGRVVDGNNLSEVAEAISEAVERARRGDGPSLIENKTYRIRGAQHPGLAVRGRTEGPWRARRRGA